MARCNKYNQCPDAGTNIVCFNDADCSRRSNLKAPQNPQVSPSNPTAGLYAEMVLMLDVLNSCIETGIVPAVDSKCQHKIIELMRRPGRKPTATKTGA